MIMMRLYPLVLCLVFLSCQLSAEVVAGIELDSLERPSGVQLNSREILKERSARRNVRSALRLITEGETQAKTEDGFSKLLNKSIDKSDVREAGKKKSAAGEARLKQAAAALQEIYATAQARAELTFEARNEGLLYEWTSTDGRTLSARFISMSGNNINVMTAAGDKYAIPLERLIENDRSVAKIFEVGRGFNATGFLETIASGNISQLEYFIDAGFQPPQAIHGEAFLKCISLEQNASMLQRLIDLGLNVNSHSANGTTPLSQAVQAGKLGVVRVLLSADADPLQRDTGDPAFAPITWALHKGDPVIVAMLFEHSKEQFGDVLSSLSVSVNSLLFKPISLEQAKKLQEIMNGTKLPYADLQAFKLSLPGLEITISDLEKVMIAKELRPLVISYHSCGFYRHTIRRNQEYIRSLIEVWEQQHNAGEYAASYSLALAYLEGWGDLVPPDRAREYLTTAIAGEHTPSMILMGELFEAGQLGEVNIAKAYDLYRQAAGLSDPLGMVKLGHCYEQGLFVEQDLKKAVVWYERATENGSQEGMAQLGRCYLNGIGVRKDERFGLEWYYKAAEANNLSAMSFLGEALLNGSSGIRENTKEGINWLKRAAEFGELSALVPLAIAYSDGTVGEDLSLANTYLEEAAERGDTEAMYLFANNLRNGYGIAKNNKRAFEWYQKAANNEHLEAINQLAVFYSSGMGVAQNQRKAFELFKQASSLGNMDATANLAISYARGLGTPVNKDESARLYLKVINSNDASAKEILKLLTEEN